MLAGRIRTIRNWPAKRLAVGLAGVSVLLIGSAVMARPASADTTTSLEHVCKVIGADSYGNEAVICTDLLGTFDGTFYGVEARTEAFCLDDGGDYVQCANIEVSTEVATGTTVDGGNGGVCGHQYGPCPAVRFYGGLVAGAGTYYNGCIYNSWESLRP